MNWVQEELTAFWNFVAERQKIWERKSQGQPRPWTKDPILESNHFTNAYRELDPGTEWMVENILNKPGLTRTSKSFWCLLYRYCGSNRHSWQAVDITALKRYDGTTVAKQLESTGKPFGDAYKVSPMTTTKLTQSKTMQVCRNFEEIAAGWKQTFKAARNAESAEQSYLAIRTCRKGVGDFTAYQGWLDMMYPDEHGDQLIEWFDRDGWVVAGPGALKGLSNLAGHPLTGSIAGLGEARARIDDLWEQQNKELTKRWFPWLWTEYEGSWDDDVIPLWKSDIQNCLCEWSKYVRIRDTGLVTRKYVPSL